MHLFGFPILAAGSMTAALLGVAEHCLGAEGDWPGLPSVQAGGLKGPLVNMSIWSLSVWTLSARRAAVVTAEAGNTFGSRNSLPGEGRENFHDSHHCSEPHFLYHCFGTHAIM